MGTPQVTALAGADWVKIFEADEANIYVDPTRICKGCDMRKKIQVMRGCFPNYMRSIFQNRS